MDLGKGLDARPAWIWGSDSLSNREETEMRASALCVARVALCSAWIWGELSFGMDLGKGNEFVLCVCQGVIALAWVGCDGWIGLDVMVFGENK
ncbi:unnamed protein product, partial [Ilex paraguariensis]